MVLVLSILIPLNLAALAATSLLGIFMQDQGAVWLHVAFGFLTAILVTFTHVLVLFYLIGTGMDIREAVSEDPELRERFVPWTRVLKRRAFPWVTVAVTLTILASVLGGEVHSRVIRPEPPLPLRDVPFWWVHLALVTVALVVNGIAYWVEFDVVRENRRGIDEINRIYAEREGGEAQSPAVPRERAGSERP